MLRNVFGESAAQAAAFFPMRRPAIVRDLGGLPETLARAGALELKLAITKKEIRAVQKMRYRVFFEEGGAMADPFTRAQRRDNCPYDRVCDHIIVVDHDAAPRPGRRKAKVVGAYRVLRQDAIAGPASFYAANEFDVAQMIARHPDKRFLELGRSCVLAEYRSRRVLEMLWRGVWAYVRHHGVDVLFGCASLPGADPAAHKSALAFLKAHAGAGVDWRVRPVHSHARANAPVWMDGIGGQSARGVVSNLPPLIKGYLRLGAQFSDGVFVDRAFGTTDVFVTLPVAHINARYVEHFSGGLVEQAA